MVPLKYCTCDVLPLSELSGQVLPSQPAPSVSSDRPVMATVPDLDATWLPSRYSAWVFPAAVSTAKCHFPSSTTADDAIGVYAVPVHASPTSLPSEPT